MPSPVIMTLVRGDGGPSPARWRSHSARYSECTVSWRTRLGGITGASLVFALLLAASLVVWKFARPSPRSTSQSLVAVDLAPAATPPDPMEDVAPGPEQVERQKTQVALPPPVFAPPALLRLSPTDTLAVPPREPVEAPAPGPPVPETRAPKSVAAPVANRLSSEDRPDWEGILLAHIERFRRYPARARAARQQGVVYVRFTMNRSGKVMAVSVVRSSGNATLDKAALDTVHRSQPLPAIPADRSDPQELTMPVEFFVRRDA
ncbi:MAG: TonB family protein [Novosphingobium sp.]